MEIRDNSQFDYDDHPNVVDVHIHLDERHPPDPVGASDWVIFSFAMTVLLIMFMGNIFLLFLSNKSAIIRAKNIPIVWVMSLASAIHIVAVLLNEIFLPLQRAITQTVSLNGTLGVDTTSDSSIDYPSGWYESLDLGPKPAGGFLSSSAACVILYFWFEYFLGLGLYLAMVALRLIILNHASGSAKAAIKHLRKKVAVRTFYVLMFLLPLFALSLFISTRGVSHMILFPMDEVSSSQGSSLHVEVRYDNFIQLDLPRSISYPEILRGVEGEVTTEFDSENYEYIGISNRASCETDPIYKFILISILAGYGIIIGYLARKLSLTDLDLDYVSSTLHIVYISIPLLIIAAILHFLHTLSYQWGRFFFVLVVLCLHLFGYFRIVLPGLGEYLAYRCCGSGSIVPGTRPDDQMQTELKGIGSTAMVSGNFYRGTMNRFSRPRKSGIAAGHSLTSDILDADTVLAMHFYEFCKKTGKGMTCCYATGMFSPEDIFNTRSETRSYIPINRFPMTSSTSSSPSIIGSSRLRTTEKEDDPPDVETIISCIHELSNLILIMEALKLNYSPKTSGSFLFVPTDPVMSKATATSGVLKMKETYIDFSSYPYDALKPIAKLGTSIKTTYLLPRKKKPARIPLNKKLAHEFIVSWSMSAVVDWVSTSVYDLKELLQTYLLLAFSDDYLLYGMPKTVSESTQRVCSTVAHLLDDGLVSQETLENILNDLDGETSYRALFPGNLDDYKKAVHNDVGEQSEYIRAARKRITIFRKARLNQMKKERLAKKRREESTVREESNGGGDSVFEILGPRKIKRVPISGIYSEEEDEEGVLLSEEEEDEDSGKEEEEEGKEKRSIEMDADGISRPLVIPETDLINLGFRKKKYSSNPLWLLLEGPKDFDETVDVNFHTECTGERIDDDQNKTMKTILGRPIETIEWDTLEEGGSNGTSLTRQEEEDSDDSFMKKMAESVATSDIGTGIAWSQRKNSHLSERDEIEAWKAEYTQGGTRELIKESEEVIVKMVQGLRVEDERKRNCPPRPKYLGKGMVLYPTVVSAFSHFIYHFWLWLCLPIRDWKSAQWFYEKLQRTRCGRRFLQSEWVPRPLAEIGEDKVYEQQIDVELFGSALTNERRVKGEKFATNFPNGLSRDDRLGAQDLDSYGGSTSGTIGTGGIGFEDEDTSDTDLFHGKGDLFTGTVVDLL